MWSVDFRDNILVSTPANLVSNAFASDLKLRIIYFIEHAIVLIKYFQGFLSSLIKNENLVGCIDLQTEFIEAKKSS